jgi:phage major head subunit gpT-like protein
MVSAANYKENDGAVKVLRQKDDNIGIYSRLSSKVSKTITPGNHFKIHSSDMLKLTPASCYNPQFFSNFS